MESEMNFQKEMFAKTRVGFITFGMRAEHYMEGGKGEDKESYPIDRTQVLHDESIKKFKNIADIELFYNEQVAWDPVSAISQVNSLERNDIDCLICMIGGWVFANQAVAAFKNVKVPACLWAHTDKESFAFVGSIVSHGALDNFGIKHEYFFGEHTDSSVIEGLLKFSRGAKTVKRLNNQIMADIGGRCMGMYNSVADPVQVRDVFGVEVYHIDQGTIIESAKNLPLAEVSDKVEEIKHDFGEISVDELKLKQAVSLYLAIKNEMVRQHIFFGALKCQPELVSGYCSGCLAVALLNDELISIACESDINAALTMRIMSIMSGQPAFFADVEHIDFRNNIIHLFNCGGAATKLSPGKESVNLHSPPDFMGVAGGVNTQYCCKEGNVTLARLDRIDGKYIMLLLKGFSRYIEPENFEDTVAQWPHAFIEPGFDTKLLFPQLRSEHIHMVYGDYTNEIEYVCRLLDIKTITL